MNVLMSDVGGVLILLCLLILAAAVGGFVTTWWRGRNAAASGDADRAQEAERLEQRLDALSAKLNAIAEAAERSERGQREEQRANRTELADALGKRFDSFERRLAEANEANDRRSAELRQTLEQRLLQLQQGNEAKLEQMRATVDEKLHATLETRLGESFKQVSERLEQVHAGLGEMRTLAVGVGDLKRVLGNVKTRGVMGEAQLAAILDELLTVEQYSSNVATRPGSSERVEFAVKLPGTGDAPVWLPIDAKFPREDYERLLDAQERADGDAAAAAGKALEQRIRLEAKSIAEKYIAPPYTTDFAVLFLPTEGLYAEVLRRPGLFESTQREFRVVIAGPTTLSALLNSLRVGFRTLAIEKRSSEVWQVLGAVRTEFGKFGDVLEKTRKKLDEAANVIDSAGVRTRAIERKLKTVEALDSESAQRLLGDLSSPIDPDEG